MTGQWLLENWFWVYGMWCTCVCVYGVTRDTGVGGNVWQKSVLFDDLMLYLCRSVDLFVSVWIWMAMKREVEGVEGNNLLEWVGRMKIECP